MPRDNGNNRQMRERIAQLAARLMAVDGIDDYALAKRKAARQAGAPGTRNLPNNDDSNARCAPISNSIRPTNNASDCVICVNVPAT